MKTSKIQFCKYPDKVSMKFHLSFSQYPIWVMGIALLCLTVQGRPPIWISLLLLPGIVAIVYFITLGRGQQFRADLRLAGIRGLADGAAQELALLQMKSPTAGTPGASASSSRVFKSAASG